MNVLYMYKQSKWGKELKFSLRSVEKYLAYEDVYIVGDKPEWLTGVVHIGCDHLQDRFEDVNNKMRIALQEIPFMSHVLSMHDDIFLLEPYTSTTYYKGLLKDASVGGDRKRAFNNTMPHVSNGCKNYGLHYPMPFMNILDWNFDNPVSYMNILGDYFPYPSVEAEDCKFKVPTQKQLEGLPCFSTHSESDDLLPLMLKLYPEKSIFEL